MKLAPFIALRYLFARKSHNVINVISAISAVGMAVGTAALILILSVYNGFDRIIKDNISDLDPDILVQPDSGRVFVAGGFPELEALKSDGRVADVRKVLQDKVFANYEGQQMIVVAKGIEDNALENSPLAGHLLEGLPQIVKGDLPMACIGSGVSHKLGIHARFVEGIDLYYPDGSRGLSPSNPASSLRRERVFAGSVFSVSADIDNSTILVPLALMQRLTGTGDDAVSGIEIRLADNSDRAVRSFCNELQEKAGSGFRVLDRYAMHPSLYRMMRLEKAAIFLILAFVVLIVAFNIFGSLSMLIIEKAPDIGTLAAMGADDALIRRIFVLEGWFISLSGMIVGLIAGIALTLIQQHTGFVKMPGNYLISSYPVELRFTDILLTLCAVVPVGLVVSLMASGGKNLKHNERS